MRLLFCAIATWVVGSVLAEDAATVRIFPDIDRLPANFLKFYLEFPEPMERGDMFRYLRLVEIDEKGIEISEVPEPFREVELWDESFTRATVWLHPGRQKPGVNLNLEMGPILEENKQYRFEISSEWRTETGVALGVRSAKEFDTSDYDDEQPNPAGWGYGQGFEADGRAATLVHTLEALDPISAKRRVEIFVGDEKVPFEVSANRIAFRSVAKGDSFRVIVDPRLEDLAGNSVARPFNLDRRANPDFEEIKEPIILEFPQKINLSPDADFP